MPSEPSPSSSSHADQRRSQRVLLRVPLLVRAAIAAGEPPLTEDTTTLEVNAHGALISLAMKVTPGQKLTLHNWSTAKEQDCRVVHVRDNPYGKNEVGVCFPLANARFWNIDFPPENWQPYLK